MSTGHPVRVLFVCTGNICRSPTAEGVARRVLAKAGLGVEVEFDSAGTHGFHVGEPPDVRTIQAANRRGYDLSPLRARRLELVDFERFDLLLAMDRGHLQQMQSMCPPHLQQRVGLFMAYAPQAATDEVPDPYYGDGSGFEHVLDLCESAVGGLLKRIAVEGAQHSALR